MSEPGTSDADRFLALVKPIEQDLENYCRRLVWEPQEAPDALQNAVLRGFAAFYRYREGASFRAWMFQIVTREALAINRKRVRLARHEFQLEPEELEQLAAGDPPRLNGAAPISEAELDKVLEPALTAGLRTLTDTERAVLLLRAIGELRYREISDTLGIPLGSVMGNLARARQKMRLLLGRCHPGTKLRKEN